jgi:hypothetical protein
MRGIIGHILGLDVRGKILKVLFCSSSYSGQELMEKLVILLVVTAYLFIFSLFRVDSFGRFGLAKHLVSTLRGSKYLCVRHCFTPISEATWLFTQ